MSGAAETLERGIGINTRSLALILDSYDRLKRLPCATVIIKLGRCVSTLCLPARFPLYFKIPMNLSRAKSSWKRDVFPVGRNLDSSLLK